MAAQPTLAAARPGHMVQLDALRAFAVLAVAVYHLWPAAPQALGFAAWGAVRLFFVLSGFLVTGVLLRARDAVDAGQGSVGAALARFHSRRMVRIAPVYLGVILGLALVDAGEVRASLGWHLAFLSNVKFVIDGYHHAYVAQFWFLAAQEQFYLLWPVLMLVLPRRALLPATLLVIAIGPAYRAVALHLDWTVACEALLPANLDTLGLGAWMAHLAHRPHGGGLQRLRTRPWALAAVAALALLVAREVPAVRAALGLPGFALGDLLMGLVSVVVVAHAAEGWRGLTGRLMSWSPVLWLGTISYGVFAYHLAVGGLVQWAVAALGLAPLPPLPGCALAVLLTIAVAAASWRWFEQPLARRLGR